MPCYCSVLTSNQAIFDGTHVLSGEETGTVRNCYVATMDSSAELILGASGSKPFGLFYDHLDLIFQVTVAAGTVDCIDINAFNLDKYTNVATGQYEALIGADAFVAGTVPAQNATLYAGASGKIAVLGEGACTYRIGKCIDASVTVQHRTGSYSASKCMFDFDQF